LNNFCGWGFELDFGSIFVPYVRVSSGSSTLALGLGCFSFAWFSTVSACLTFQGAVMTTLGVAAL
jgi:hypothetical protein